MTAGHNGALGRRGEDAAVEWYEAHGYEIVARNWRTRRGEIDAIVRRNGTIVFVEVKTRTSARYGTGAAAVGWKKQQRIRSLAVGWLADQPDYHRSIRFDVVDVDARGHVQVFEGCF